MKEHGSETPTRGGDSDSWLEAITIPLKFGGSLHDLREQLEAHPTWLQSTSHELWW
jgi:hypothetical protein